jgi:hypothetical protein
VYNSTSFHLVILILQNNFLSFYYYTEAYSRWCKYIISGIQQTEWGWSLQEHHKHWYPYTKLYGITSQNTVMFTCTSVKTSNVSSYLHFFQFSQQFNQSFCFHCSLHIHYNTKLTQWCDIKSDVYAKMQKYERKKEVVFLDPYQYLMGVVLPAQMLQLPRGSKKFRHRTSTQMPGCIYSGLVLPLIHV